MKKFLAVTVALAFPLAACGGSDDSAIDDAGADAGAAATAESSEVGATASDAAPEPVEAATADSDAVGDAATTEQAPADGGAAEGTGPSTATVTIGDDTYEFSTEDAVVAQCQTDMFGVFSVQLPRVGGDGGVSIIALLEDTDPAVVEQVNEVKVGVGDDDWIADEASDFFDMSEQLQPGMSQVDSVEVDGSTVRGTATFFRQDSAMTGEIETATGTFEATCGEERLS